VEPQLYSVNTTRGDCGVPRRIGDRKGEKVKADRKKALAKQQGG